LLPGSYASGEPPDRGGSCPAVGQEPGRKEPGRNRAQEPGRNRPLGRNRAGTTCRNRESTAEGARGEPGRNRPGQPGEPRAGIGQEPGSNRTRGTAARPHHSDTELENARKSHLPPFQYFVATPWRQQADRQTVYETIILSLSGSDGPRGLHSWARARLLPQPPAPSSTCTESTTTMQSSSLQPMSSPS
jgi:hypothetical protein